MICEYVKFSYGMNPLNCALSISSRPLFQQPRYQWHHAFHVSYGWWHFSSSSHRDPLRITWKTFLDLKQEATSESVGRSGNSAENLSIIRQKRNYTLQL